MDIFDGKKLSLSYESNFKNSVNALKKDGIEPFIAVILVGEDEASKLYTDKKAEACNRIGIKSEILKFSNKITTEELLLEIEKLNENESVDAILVQLPLPNHIDKNMVLEKISPTKDVDGFHPENIGKVHAGINALTPATPLGIMEIFKYKNISLRGKDVSIIGASNIVGKPLSSLMLNEGATVSVLHIHTKNIKLYTKEADIICIATGSPKMLKRDMIKEGVIIIDIGINKLSDGKICGDSDFENIKDACSLITPVPGGVGPMTVTMLLKNIIDISKNRGRNKK